MARSPKLDFPDSGAILRCAKNLASRHFGAAFLLILLSTEFSFPHPADLALI
jgi:hypothetical protein